MRGENKPQGVVIVASNLQVICSEILRVAPFRLCAATCIKRSPRPNNIKINPTTVLGLLWATHNVLMRSRDSHRSLNVGNARAPRWACRNFWRLST